MGIEPRTVTSTLSSRPSVRTRTFFGLERKNNFRVQHPRMEGHKLIGIAPSEKGLRLNANSSDTNPARHRGLVRSGVSARNPPGGELWRYRLANGARRPRGSRGKPAGSVSEAGNTTTSVHAAGRTNRSDPGVRWPARFRPG